MVVLAAAMVFVAHGVTDQQEGHSSCIFTLSTIIVSSSSLFLLSDFTYLRFAITATPGRNTNFRLERPPRC
jgi:hypothetical protein